MPYFNEPQTPCHVDHASLDWAVKHIEEMGDNYMFPPPFEFQAIQADWANVRDWLGMQDMVKWPGRPNRRLLAPKGANSFRPVSQLDPLESILLAALIHSIGADLEAFRMDTDVVFSWRFAPQADGRMFSAAHNWDSFTERSIELAESDDFSHVVITDIADFYARIYLHPIERALADATGFAPEAYCVLRMIRNWNAFVSYGVPIGPSPARLVAEVTIDDVDRTLAGQGTTFTRYADDFRLFARSEDEARQVLVDLADVLFENHGLTLNDAKTQIVSTAEFIERVAEGVASREVDSLSSRFFKLVEDAGFDRYENLEYAELPEETQEEIDKLNLFEMFEEELDEDHPNTQLLRFVLGRLAQLDDDSAVDAVLAHPLVLYHLVDSVVRYLLNLRSLDAPAREEIGGKVLNVASDPVDGHLDYRRMWLLSVFTHSEEFDHSDRFERLYNDLVDGASRRELTLALGRASLGHWFMRRRRNVNALPPWERRAFLAAASCMSKDTLPHFYRSLRGGQDYLDGVVMNWAQDNPFS